MSSARLDALNHSLTDPPRRRGVGRVLVIVALGLILVAAVAPGTSRAQSGPSPSPAATQPSGSHPGASSSTPSSLGSPDATASPGGTPVDAGVRARSPGPTAVPGASPVPSSAVAPVVLEGVELLRVGKVGPLSATERALVLQDRLQGVLRRATRAPEVTVVLQDDNPILVSEGHNLVMITDGDARGEGAPKAIVAVKWRTSLESGLAHAWREYSGEYVKTSTLVVFLILLLAMVTHVGIGWGARRYFRAPGWSLQGLLWIGVAVGVLWQFPNTRSLGTLLGRNLAQPAFEFVGLLLACLVGRVVLGLYISRYFRATARIQHETASVGSRRWQRLATAQQASMVVANAIFAFFLGMGLLGILRIQPTTLLASAGIVGVSLGVAAQDLLRSLNAGFGILVEDQFGVGDFIQVGDVEGEVVAFTLRSTRIRTSEGTLVTLANGSIRSVSNLSSEWACVDLKVCIRYDPEDVRQGLELMEQAGKELRAAQPESVLGDPEVLGMDGITEQGAILRVRLKTAPFCRLKIRRLLVERLAHLFFDHHIDLVMERKTKDDA